MGARKAHSLIGQVYDPRNLARAWQQVKKNKGAGGVDGVTITRFEQNQDHYLDVLHHKRRSPRSTQTPPASRTPTGCRSWSGATNCSDSPTLRSSDSTVPSPVGEADGAPAGLSALADSTRTSRDAMRSLPISTNATATSNSLPASTPLRPATRRTSQSAITRLDRQRGSTTSCVTSDDKS